MIYYSASILSIATSSPCTESVIATNHFPLKRTETPRNMGYWGSGAANEQNEPETCCMWSRETIKGYEGPIKRNLETNLKSIPLAKDNFKHQIKVTGMD